MLAEQRTPQHSMVREQSYSNSITPFGACVSILCPPSFPSVFTFLCPNQGICCETEGSLFWEEGKDIFCTQHSESFYCTLQKHCKGCWQLWEKDADSSPRTMLKAYREWCWKPKAHREWCWKPTKSGAESSQRMMLKATAVALNTRNFTA